MPFSSFTVIQLRDKLRARELQTVGRKAVLVDRLVEAIRRENGITKDFTVRLIRMDGKNKSPNTKLWQEAATDVKQTDESPKDNVEHSRSTEPKKIEEESVPNEEDVRSMTQSSKSKTRPSPKNVEEASKSSKTKSKSIPDAVSVVKKGTDEPSEKKSRKSVSNEEDVRSMTLRSNSKTRPSPKNVEEANKSSKTKLMADAATDVKRTDESSRGNVEQSRSTDPKKVEEKSVPNEEDVRSMTLRSNSKTRPSPKNVEEANKSSKTKLMADAATDVKRTDESSRGNVEQSRSTEPKKVEEKSVPNEEDVRTMTLRSKSKTRQSPENVEEASKSLNAKSKSIADAVSVVKKGGDEPPEKKSRKSNDEQNRLKALSLKRKTKSKRIARVPAAALALKPALRKYEMVWAHVKGFRNWPGIIESETPKGKYIIHFFGDYSTSEVSKNKIMHLMEGFKDYEAIDRPTPLLCKAIAEAQMFILDQKRKECPICEMLKLREKNDE